MGFIAIYYQNNQKQMVLFISYLYDVLPTWFPARQIEMKTNWSEKAYEQVEIPNPNKFSVKYTAMFFCDEKVIFGCRTVSGYRTKRRNNFQYIIEYFAKFIKNPNAYLLLRGECFGLKCDPFETYKVYLKLVSP